MCGICGGIENSEPLNLFDDKDYERIYAAIFNGIITVANLDYNTYQKIATKLTEGVFQGYGKTIDQTFYGTPDHTMLSDLRENVYIFSAAKTYQQTREVYALLVSGNNHINSYSEFAAKAKTILKEYNENYLRTEYNSAIMQANAAKQWQGIEQDKEHHPMLEYHTVGDQRVRFSHKIMDGITKPVGDVFWKTAYPPNDWNCRCTVLQLGGDAERVNAPMGFKKDNHIPEIFQFNPGIERIIFSPKHPYFDVASKDKTLARNNFGMPLP